MVAAVAERDPEPRPGRKRSPLVGRLQRMKRELSMGNDTFERKLRYLLWLN
jgi:hypothetical protein